MPPLLWIALLLGYLTGVVAAVVLLPGAVAAPLRSGLLAATGVVALAATLIVVISRRSPRTAVRTAAETAPGGHPRTEPAEDSLEPTAPMVAPPAPRDMRDPAHLPPADTEALQPFAVPSVTRLLGIRLDHGLSIDDVRAALEEDRLDAVLRPVLDLDRPELPILRAMPRLRSAQGRALTAAAYLSSAARGGYLAQIDRLLMNRSIARLRLARSGELALRVVCSISGASLHDPALEDDLDRLSIEQPELLPALMIEIDRLRLGPPADSRMARLVARGFRFCLRRLNAEQLDADVVASAGFAQVLLDGTGYGATAEAVATDPELQALAERLRPTGLSLLIDQPGGEVEIFPSTARPDGGGDVDGRQHAA